MPQEDTGWDCDKLKQRDGFKGTTAILSQLTANLGELLYGAAQFPALSTKARNKDSCEILL